MSWLRIVVLGVGGLLVGLVVAAVVVGTLITVEVMPYESALPVYLAAAITIASGIVAVWLAVRARRLRATHRP